MLIVLCVALVSRLAFLFLVPGGLQNVGWYLDSYHHWQIAYFTLKIGIFQGRLWDLGGVEYFWGILPPLVQAGLLGLFNSTSIIFIRLANSLFGSISVAIVYFIVKRYFGLKSGLIAAILCAINPVLIAADTSGMNEPMGIMFLLAGVYFYDRSEFRSGILFALASMTRAEYWILSLGVIMLYLVFERNATRFIPNMAGWLALMIPYMWHLRVVTGNPFYPLYWNFLGNISGQWVTQIALTGAQQSIKYFFVFGLIASTTLLVVLFKRKPRSYPVIALFLGYFAMQSVVFGFSAYINGWTEWYPFDRIFSLDYVFVAVLVSVAAAKSMRKGSLKLPKINWRMLGVALVVVALLLQTLLFPPILSLYSSSLRGYQSASQFATFVVSQYRSGTILVPGSEVYLTYALVNDGITAQHILSEKYHPKNCNDTMMWLQENNVTLALINPDDSFYQGLIQAYARDFSFLQEQGIQLYSISYV